MRNPTYTAHRRHSPHTLDRRKQADLLFLDFSKAFDKVPHRRPAHKLDWYGVRNKNLACITAFMKDRTQRVLPDGETSTPRPVTSGVPQDTVLGPVLFLAYINDLHDSITKSNVILFADDCVLYRDITDRNDTDLLQQDLDVLGRWEAKWLMEFNVDKWFVKHATHSKHKIQHQYTLHNQTLTPVKHSKYLGVTLSDDLTWRTHISNVVGDASALQNTQLPPQNSPHRIAKHQSPCLQSTCSTKTRIRVLYYGIRTTPSGGMR